MRYCSRCGKPLAEEAFFCPNCGEQVRNTTGEAQASSLGEYRSGIDALTKSPQAQEYWIKRLIAVAIDYVIVGVVVWFLGLIIAIPPLLIQGITGASVILPLNIGIPSLSVGILAFFYFLFSETIFGETIGKFLMRMRVRKTNGARISLEQALIRNISKIYWLLLLLDVIVGLALEVDYKQKYSDKYAGAIVVS